MSASFVVSTMARRGLLKPGPPGRVLRQFGALRRWGFGLAGELRQAAARDPGRVAVIDDERGDVTYAELLDRSVRIARALPVAPGDRVGVLRRNSAAMIETVIGVASAGADPVLINTGLSSSQIARIFEDQQLRLLVHDQDFPGDFPTSRLDALAAAAPAADIAPPARPGRTIVLTSGTTGLPKGARRPTPSGFRPLCSIIDRIPLRAGSRILIAAPLFHTWGFAGLQIALALRATVVVRRKFSPDDVLETLSRTRCSALIAVPVMLSQLLELGPRHHCRTWTWWRSAGRRCPAASPPGSWTGSATCSTTCTARPRRPGRPSRPRPHGTKVAVLDSAGRPVPPGTTGRLFVGNEMLFEGYTSGASREIHDGLLATGDLGHVDTAGRVFVSGREDDMIVSGGENVFPSEVEDLLADLPPVREVAVIGVPDDQYGQRLAAYLVLHDGATLDADEIRAHVRLHRARFCVPRDVVFLPSLPRNATGKILKRELPR
jgi:acyl-CoA synthetase (AMP-forming)/AMP-acid ligase II